MKARPLEWQADHGIAAFGPYRLFYAETPLGRFAFGTDSEGSCWWHSSASGVFMVGDEAAARRMAEAAWEKMALAEASKFVFSACPTLHGAHPQRHPGGAK